MQATSSQSHLRILICTIAFGMGVNFLGFHECIHFGAPGSIENYIQESGRIGRDNQPSISRIFFNGMLLRGADGTIRNYINETSCQRYSLMKNFPLANNLKTGSCKCCDNCTKSCDCQDENCGYWLKDRVAKKLKKVEISEK